MNKTKGQFSEIYRWVRRIPRGRVLSYGDIAALCRSGVSARTVGWALSVCPDDLPWHRVVNHQGRLTIGRRSLVLQEIQRQRLLAEGVRFVALNQIAMDRHRWNPRSPAKKARPAARKCHRKASVR
ncbi:MAG TPA: MGMT family protein [Blastocatellia bacterium]|nr:MGMT family protein [Blastocatellia bacterium]